MNKLSTIVLAMRAACVFGFCLLAAGLGFYVFDEVKPGMSRNRRNRSQMQSFAK
jgi:hypothetical protein